MDSYAAKESKFISFRTTYGSAYVIDNIIISIKDFKIDDIKVPEPSTFFLLGGGLISLFFTRFRRKMKEKKLTFKLDLF